MPVEIHTLEEARNRSYTDLVIHYKMEAPSYMKDSPNYPRAQCNAPAASYYTSDTNLITCTRCRRNVLGVRW